MQARDINLPFTTKILLNVTVNLSKGLHDAHCLILIRFATAINRKYAWVCEECSLCCLKAKEEDNHALNARRNSLLEL